MLENLFRGLFDTDLTAVISVTDFLLCLGCSLVLGLVMAFAYMYRTRYTKSFVITLALLPAVVCVVIMLVNGNVGTGVAVAGAFSLVRFRSVPGTAKEICTLFLAMGAGLIAGMGYLGFAVLFTLVLCAVFVLYNCLDFGTKKNAATFKTFTITIPEDLDYSGVFDDIFAEFTRSHDLVRVKTTNMGSMFKLTYNVELADATREKEMIDKLRCRNGNLEIAVSKQETVGTELFPGSVPFGWPLLPHPVSIRVSIKRMAMILRIKSLRYNSVPTVSCLDTAISRLPFLQRSLSIISFSRVASVSSTL